MIESALPMKAVSLTYMPMTPQVCICSTEVFRPPSSNRLLDTSIRSPLCSAWCPGHGGRSIKALCSGKRVFSDIIHSDSLSQLARYRSETRCLHFSPFRAAMAMCQVWSTVPICNKLHILANSSTISPLSSFRTLGWMPSIPVIYLHLECHSRTSCPFTTASDFAVLRYNWGVGIFHSVPWVTAGAKNSPQLPPLLHTGL